MDKDRQIAPTKNKPYEIVGTGKKHIVFVHYFGGDAGSWKWLVKRLSKNFTCVLLNLPGFNNTENLEELSIYSYANFINQQIEKLNIKDYILCGHSMGGKLALYAAQIMMGEKPEKILLIAPSPPTVENMPEEEKQRMLNHPNKEEAIKTVEKVTKKKLRKEKRNYAIESQLRIDSKAWKWWITEGMNEDISERIATLDIPTFVICSKKDPAISIDAIYKEVMPNLVKPSILVLNRVGHLIPMESPRKLARQIKRISKLKY
jgi:pimeloyl-ACP methyl ester carboxylesterase